MAASLCFGSIALSLAYCLSSESVSPALSSPPSALAAPPSFALACITDEKSSSSKSGNRRVSIFWDLDNKPPKSSPFHVALQLRRVATQFGNIADMVACANRHTFLHIPRWVQEESGFIPPDTDDKHTCNSKSIMRRPHVLSTSSCMCALCGIRCATHAELKKHARLSHRQASKNMSFKLHESGGYGLHTELLRAGFCVRMVDQGPQAADRALKRQIKHSMNNNIYCICLVSDDSDFTEILKTARSKQVFVVVIGDSASLHHHADVWFSWTEVAHGKRFAGTHTWQCIDSRSSANNDMDDISVATTDEFFIHD